MRRKSITQHQQMIIIGAFFFVPLGLPSLTLTLVINKDDIGPRPISRARLSAPSRDERLLTRRRR